MECNNGTCAGVMGSAGCCFECSFYADCLIEIKCDDRAGYEAGTCLGKDS